MLRVLLHVLLRVLLCVLLHMLLRVLLHVLLCVFIQVQWNSYLSIVPSQSGATQSPTM